MRWCTAGLVVLGAGGRARLTWPHDVRGWAGLAVVGVLGGSVPFVLFFEGLARASSAQSAFLHKTLVVWVALLAVPLLGERFGRWHALAVALLVLGQLGLSGGVPRGFGSGEAMILAATLLWSVEVVVAKRLLASVSSWTVALVRMGVGSAVLVGWLAVQGQAGALLAMTGEQLRWVLLTGVVLAAYVGTWFAALARAQAVDVTAVLVLAALVTATLAGVRTGQVAATDLLWLGVVGLGGAVLTWSVLRDTHAASRSLEEAAT